MTLRVGLQALLLTLLMAGQPATAASTIQALSAHQPTAPGFQPAAPLPELNLKHPIPEVQKVEYLSNGHIEVAGALVLVSRSTPVADLIKLSQQVARETLNSRAALNEVDISIFARENYAGFGGPPPLLTASVPRSRINEFLALQPQNWHFYERLWVAQHAVSVTANHAHVAPVDDQEKVPLFQGTTAQLIQQLTAQRKARQTGDASMGVVLHGDPQSQRAALTFDDAVHPIFAPLLLDALRQSRTKATFFVVGRNVFAYPYFLQDLVSEGHEIGNHTYHHIRATDLSLSQLETEIRTTNQLVFRLTGQQIKYFRPPGGRYSLPMIDLLQKMGMSLAFWTDDPADFDNPPPALLQKRFVRQLRPGGIILLHDNARETVGMIGQLIQLSKNKGIELVPLGDLMHTQP